MKNNKGKSVFVSVLKDTTRVRKMLLDRYLNEKSRKIDLDKAYQRDFDWYSFIIGVCTGFLIISIVKTLVDYFGE